MSLLTHFRQRIASLTQIDEASHIQIGIDGILIGSKTLPLENVFFSEDSIRDSQSCPLSDYLEQYEVKPGHEFTLQCKSDDALSYKVIRLRVENQNIQHGFYEILNNNSERNGIIFTGSLSGSIDQPNLTEFQEALFAICLLDAVRPLNEVGWSDIFESLGPFAIFTGEYISYGLLADCGIFSPDITTFSFSWTNEIPQVFRSRKDNIPQEAETAYIAALSNSGSPDVAFTRLYRVLEILFAVGLKTKVENSPVTEVLRVMKEFQRLSELDMLKTLLENSSTNFVSFTLIDFTELYGSHKPEGNYQKITNWLNTASSTPLANPPDDLVSMIIYYIRCSLVHSKLGEKEPFLLGPFSVKQIDALSHLVDDLRSIINSLVY